MGLLTACFVLGGGFLYTMIVPREGFACFESCPGGLFRWERKVLDEIDSHINLTDLSRFNKVEYCGFVKQCF